MCKALSIQKNLRFASFLVVFSLAMATFSATFSATSLCVSTSPHFLASSQAQLTGSSLACSSSQRPAGVAVSNSALVQPRASKCFASIRSLSFEVGSSSLHCECEINAPGVVNFWSSFEMLLLANERGFQQIRDCVIWIPYAKVLKHLRLIGRFSTVVFLTIGS